MKTLPASEKPKNELAANQILRPAEPFLQVKDLLFSYPQFCLEQIAFCAAASQFTTVLGSNGSGKSTLLKLISGYLNPLHGCVELNGQKVHELSLLQRTRQIALVLQEAPLHFPMTVQEFVLQGRHPHLAWFKFENQSDLEKIHWALHVTDSLAFAQRKIQDLSGGERQRVILARALAQEPNLLLLDEPTLNLDLGYQVELIGLIRTLGKERKFAVVMVTHELNLAAEFSDQVVLLHQGRQVACGFPDEVLTEKNLMEVFQLDVLVDQNPISGSPRITPINNKSSRRKFQSERRED
jgi:iron complex transport system ATP-binding protein